MAIQTPRSETTQGYPLTRIQHTISPANTDAVRMFAKQAYKTAFATNKDLQRAIHQLSLNPDNKELQEQVEELQLKYNKESDKATDLAEAGATGVLYERHAYGFEKPNGGTRKTKGKNKKKKTKRR
jgi:hypothetical protein